MNTTDTALLESAAGFFEIGKIKSVEVASDGLSNNNFFVQTNHGQYVLRILRSQTVTGLVNEYAIQQQLKKAGVETATFLLGRNNNYYFKENDSVITCSTRVQGVALTPPLDTLLCKKVGVVLAIFHTKVHLPNPHQGWLNKSVVIKTCDELPDESLVIVLKKYLEESLHIFEHNLPTGSIHADLHAGNILLKEDNSLAIFDFEESQKSLLLLDIAKSMSEVCVTPDWHLEPTLMKSLLDGYNSVRQITTEEREALPLAIIYVAAASAVWLYQEGHNQFVQENLSVIESLQHITL
jgi:homoserine kinase type II